MPSLEVTGWLSSEIAGRWGDFEDFFGGGETSDYGVGSTYFPPHAKIDVIFFDFGQK